MLLCTACKPRLPKDVLPAGKMERVLHDFHFAQGMAEASHADDGLTIDERRYNLQQAVLRKHGITQAELDSSLIYYSSDLAAFARIYQHVSERIEKEAQALGAAAAASADIYAGLSAVGDTANVWAGQTVMAVRGAVRQNFVAWSMPCDSTWLIGDDLLWRFSTYCFAAQRHSELYAQLLVTYTNDSTRAAQQVIAHNLKAEVRVPNEKGWTPRQVDGMLYLPAGEQAATSLFVATGITLIRFHKSEAVRSQLAADTMAVVPFSVEGDTTALVMTGADSAAVMKADTLKALLPAGMASSSDSVRRATRPVQRKIQVVKDKPYTPHQRKPLRRRK